MAIQIVESYPASNPARHVVRFVIVILGLSLLLVGLLATVLFLGVVAAMVVPGAEVDRKLPVYLVAFGAVAVAAIWLGLRALRGRRRLGLFLRRFGYIDATSTMSAVVAGGAGRSWRMVTLDDSRIAPQGTARRYGAFSILVMLLGAAGVAWVAYWFLGGGYANLQSDLGDQMSQRIDEVQGFGEKLGAIIVYAMVSALVLVLIVVAIGFIGLVSLVVGIAGGVGRRAAKAAQRRASVVMERPDQVENSASRIARLNRRVFGSRLVVCRVTDALWQDAVRRLAGVSDAVVIDVSHATDNVVWEVETMQAVANRKWVLVCHRDRLGSLSYGGTAGSPQARLAALLDGQQVLVYGNDRSELRRFARSLRHRLDASARAR